MNRIRPQGPRLRLDPEPYVQLRKQVLRRDGWRCQICGSRQNLQSTTNNCGASGATTAHCPLVTMVYFPSSITVRLDSVRDRGQRTKGGYDGTRTSCKDHRKRQEGMYSRKTFKEWQPFDEVRKVETDPRKRF
jgi:hypothetical protein